MLKTGGSHLNYLKCEVLVWFRAQTVVDVVITIRSTLVPKPAEMYRFVVYAKKQALGLQQPRLVFSSAARVLSPTTEVLDFLMNIV